MQPGAHLDTAVSDGPRSLVRHRQQAVAGGRHGDLAHGILLQERSEQPHVGPERDGEAHEPQLVNESSRLSIDVDMRIGTPPGSGGRSAASLRNGLPTAPNRLGPRCSVCGVRTTAERIADAQAKLTGDDDVWIATGDSQGVAHLVPLSLCWHGGEIVVATEARSPTARNVAVSAQARLALGSTRDVVSIEATATIIARADADPWLVDAYRARVGWDPGAGGEWVFIRCSPVSVQVWRDLDEIAGRTVMRRGMWIE
jgi:pyridoxamine 5'-phosphate oxidase-like protein